MTIKLIYIVSRKSSIVIDERLFNIFDDDKQIISNRIDNSNQNNLDEFKANEPDISNEININSQTPENNENLFEVIKSIGLVKQDDETNIESNEKQIINDIICLLNTMPNTSYLNNKYIEYPDNFGKFRLL